MDLDAEPDHARDLSVSEPVDVIESIGFERTCYGACCKGYEGDDGSEPHMTTAFSDEMRVLQEAGEDDSKGESGTLMEWRDVVRPTSYDPVGGDDGPKGETFKWALQTTACGDCRFYERDDSGRGVCQVHENRPLICEIYLLSVALGGMSQPMGEAVDEEGAVRAHECEDLGRDASRADAEELARTLKEQAVRELREARSVIDAYESVETGPGKVAVHDSEDAKWPNGMRAQ